MSESAVITKDLQTIRNFLNKPVFQMEMEANVINASWLKNLKRSIGIGSDPTGEIVGPVDNSDIVNYLEKKYTIDYDVVTTEVWNVIQTLYGGGPDIKIEIGYDPKTGNYVPITKMNSFKIHFEDKCKKVMISKYKNVGTLIDKACKELEVPPGSYRIRDYWNHKPGKYLFPTQIICQHSLFVNTEMILEVGDYSEINEDEENSISGSTSSWTIHSLSQQKGGFCEVSSQKVLTSPEFQAKVVKTRRASHQMKAISLDNVSSSIQWQQSTPKGRNAITESFLFHRNSNPNLALLKGPPSEKRTSAPTLNIRKDIIFDTTKPRAKGLVNLDNSCCLNSILQCLVHLKPVKDYFLSKEIEEDVERQGISEHNRATAVAFANFIRHYYETGDAAASPQDIKLLFDKAGPYIHGFSQQDANGLFTNILDALNKSLNTKQVDNRRSKNENEADKEWEEHMMYNDSIIAKLFHIQVKSNIICTKCGKESATYSPCASVLLQLPSAKILSPRFTFVPYDPKLPKVSLRLPMSNKSLYKEGFMNALNTELGRNTHCVFGIHDASGSIEWLQSPNVIIGESKSLVVYEIPDPSALYIQVKLAVNTSKFISPLRAIDGPFLVKVPSSETTHEKLQAIVNDFFSYLWEPSDNNVINPDLLALIPTIKNNSSAKNRIEVELEKSLFSKTLKFKPIPECPFVSSKSVMAVIQKTDKICWQSVVRQSSKNSTVPLQRAVDLTTLISDAATPSIFSAAWKCSNCNKHVKIQRSTTFWRLPPIVVFTMKRFEDNRSVSKKNDMIVTYPSVLTLTDSVREHQYELSSICEYRGNIGHGNYVSYVKIGETEWVEFNDTAVFNRTLDEVHKAEAYMLFYTEKQN